MDEELVAIATLVEAGVTPREAWNASWPGPAWREHLYIPGLLLGGNPLEMVARERSALVPPLPQVGAAAHAAAPGVTAAFAALDHADALFHTLHGVDATELVVTGGPAAATAAARPTASAAAGRGAYYAARTRRHRAGFQRCTRATATSRVAGRGQWCCTATASVCSIGVFDIRDDLFWVQGADSDTPKAHVQRAS
jgi:hypothetical protein